MRQTTQNQGNGKGGDPKSGEDIEIIKPSPVHPDIAFTQDLKGTLKDQIQMPKEIKPDDPDDSQNQN